jgi:hypothetical protein
VRDRAASASAGSIGVARAGRRKRIGYLGPNGESPARREDERAAFPVGETERFHTSISERYEVVLNGREITRRLIEGEFVLVTVNLNQVWPGQCREPKRLAGGVDGDECAGCLASGSDEPGNRARRCAGR